MSTTMGQTGSGQTDREKNKSQGQGGQMSQGQGQGQATKMSKDPGQSGGQIGQSEKHAEGPVARSIEQQTAKIPSDVFLWAALGSIGTSAVLKLMGRDNASLFVGDWVAPLLLFGVYNKIVKLQGSDRVHGH